MNPATNNQSYRYPGVTPFTTGQANIFFGRQQDTDNLYALIRRKPIVVLFGKSGLGKSSLLNAGIVPRCTNSGDFSPLIIRFGAWTEGINTSPLVATKTALSQGNVAHGILDELLPGDGSLWYHAKSRQLNAPKGTSSGRPMLIFDQFEELFSYPDADVRAFQEELSELLNTNIPLRFRRMADAYDKLTDEMEDSFEASLEARVVFAIRSDRMHLLHSIKDNLPDKLSDWFELKALTQKDAKDAILLPAQAIGNFQTPPFEYTPTAINKLLTFLHDEQDGRVEGILLQMLCEHYERKQVATGGIKLLDLPQIGEPAQVVKRYYNEKIESLSEAQRLPARRLIEDGLVSEGEAMRLSLHESYILHEFGVDKILLEKLVDSRLLRSEPFLRGGYTYELSHDRLVPPVLSAKGVRVEEEAKVEAEQQKKELIKTRKRLRLVYGLLMAAVFALLLAGYFGYQAIQNTKEANNQKVKAENALSDFKKAEQKRKEAEINMKLINANNFLNLKQPEVAIKALQEALEIDSSRQDVRIKLEELLKK